MTEPRSLFAASNTWLSDSRVYNLIWLGRWLERAEAINRAVNSAVRSAAANGNLNTDISEILAPVASVLGITIEGGESLAGEILLDNQVASALHCLSNARMNATQVAPVELLRAISAAIMELEDVDSGSLASSQRVIDVTDTIARQIAKIHEAIEDRWFGRESLTEEEVFHRFVQQ